MRDIQNVLLFFVSIDNTRLIFLFLSLMLPKGVIFKIYLGQVTAQLKIYSGPLTSSLILFVLRFYCPVNPMGSCRARSVYERMLPTSAGVEPASSWSPVRQRIQLSHRGQQALLKIKFFIKAIFSQIKVFQKEICTK